ncbi:hypothetical protein ACJIZ3_018460 [Penstemon smallii]|uniref:F-box domain-containing protein n=1 Tax=Penstemon smallii TaxID=265156 RepID=A0ABD3SZ04_9LAMI
MEREREEVNDSEQSGLIPGLPDDISLSCLARVPRKYHHLLKRVSRQWRELVCGEEWHLYRAKHHLEETWIYALCLYKFEQLRLYVLDPNQLKKGWRQIHGIPNRCLNRKGIGFEVLGNKVYLFGGCSWIEDATDEVYCYDASVNAWTQAGPLSTARCYFSSEALNGKIYAIGGLGSKSSNPHSWDIYDPPTNSWTSHEDPNVIPDIEDSVVYDGKIYIRYGSSYVSSHVHAVVYEPSSGTWEHADSDMVRGWRGPAVVIDGVFYVLDQTSGVRLMMWEKNSREWMVVRRLSTHFTRPPCRLMAIGKKVFVIGKGLSTLVFDIENAGHKDGVLVSSSVSKMTSDDEVVSCKSLAI